MIEIDKELQPEMSHDAVYEMSADILSNGILLVEHFRGCQNVTFSVEGLGESKFATNEFEQIIEYLADVLTYVDNWLNSPEGLMK
jgi:hypothetical protein